MPEVDAATMEMLRPYLPFAPVVLGILIGVPAVLAMRKYASGPVKGVISVVVVILFLMWLSALA